MTDHVRDRRALCLGVLGMSREPTLTTGEVAAGVRRHRGFLSDPRTADRITYRDLVYLEKRGMVKRYGRPSEWSLDGVVVSSSVLR